MVSKIVIVLVGALFAVQASAQLILPRSTIRRIIFGGPTSTPYPTPSMVDLQNFNFSAPSDLASKCEKSQQTGPSFVKYCQDKSIKDFDPARVNTTTSTTWETCCAMYEEIDCYMKSAVDFCPSVAQANALVQYSRKVAYYFQYFICKEIYFYSWATYCKNETLRHKRADANAKSSYKINFIDLPMADGPERTCFTKLRMNRDANNTLQNLEKKCINQALAKWDPAQNKYLKSNVQDSCCATYDALDCVVDQAKSVCASDQLVNMQNYQKKAQSALSAVVCKAFPAGQRAKLCSAATLGGTKGGALSTMPFFGATLLTLVGTFLMLF